jgi:hypothetical protein
MTDVDGAEAVHRGLHDARAALGRHHRREARHRLAAGRPDLVDHLLRSRLVAALAVDAAAQVVDDHGRAAAGQLEGVRAAEAAAGAGDDGDPAVEADVGHGGLLSARAARAGCAA